MSSMFDAISAQAMKSMKRNKGDYIGKDGLLHCGVCGAPKQAKLTLPDGRVVTPPCMCRCQVAAQKREKAREEAQKKLTEASRLRSLAFHDEALKRCIFGHDDSPKSQASRIARNYVKHFSDFNKAGKGLLFYGNVGVGKTFYAACIANALVDKCISIIMTNFSRIANRMQGSFNGRQEYMDSLAQCGLLVVDDFAMERGTEFMQEIVYDVINDRYQSGKPLVMTTNVTKSELDNPSDLSKQRVFSRVSGMCMPVKVTGIDRRSAGHDANLLKKLFE